MIKVGYQLKESGTSLGLLPWHGLNKMVSFVMLIIAPKSVVPNLFRLAAPYKTEI